jgi:hypothetical protein
MGSIKVGMAAFLLTVFATDAWSYNGNDRYEDRIKEGDRTAFDGSNAGNESRENGWGRNVLQQEGTANNALNRQDSSRNALQGNNVLVRDGNQNALRRNGGSGNVLQGRNVLGGSGNALKGTVPARQVGNSMESASSGLEAIRKGGETLKRGVDKVFE